MRRSRRRQRSLISDGNGAGGFTLIELMISVLLMSMILVSTYLCLRAGMIGQELVEQRADAAQNARVALAMLTADLRAACPLSKDIAFLGMSRELGDTEADNLDFGTRNYRPRHQAEFDFAEVSYFLDKESESKSFSLWRRVDPTPDPEPLAGGNREEIARGLTGVRFEYYDGFEWYDEWGDADGIPREQTSLLAAGNLYGMPEAVRITLRFAADAAGSASEGETEEPPLVFQTVARLNLAPLYWSASADSASTEGANPTGEPASGTPNGGSR